MKTVFKFGGYSVFTLLFLFSASLIIIGDSPDTYEIGEVIGYASIAVSLFFVYFGMKDYKQKLGPKDFKFFKALQTGLLITLFPSVAFGLYNVIYIEILNLILIL